MAINVVSDNEQQEVVASRSEKDRENEMSANALQCQKEEERKESAQCSHRV